MPETIWSAGALMTGPDVVRQIYLDTIAAGADIITANGFVPIPQDWTLGGDKETGGLLDLREDLDPQRYAAHAAGWLASGATVVGGCCGTRPAHIASIRTLMRN